MRGLSRDRISFAYRTPHACHQGNDATGISGRAGSMVRHVHLADTLDHTASDGLRYIVNPPGSVAWVHQHAETGRGEVDLDEVFRALADTGFDGTLTSCVSAGRSVPREISVFQRDRTLEPVGTHFGADAAEAPRSTRTIG